MAKDDGYFDFGFRFLSHDANSALQALRAQYEVRLIESRHSIEHDGWVMTESGRRISHAAQIRLVDVLIEMVETLYESAAKAYVSAVGSSEYKERVDLVERQLVGYAMERWAQLTRGLSLEPVGFDPAAEAVLGSNEELLSATLAAHVQSKALKLELQMWQTEVAAQSGDLASGKLQSEPAASGLVTGDLQGAAMGAMPTQLPDDARRRLEEGHCDLRRRCWVNVQRLHKWSGKLEREGPSGEDADFYERMGPESFDLGPIVWDGPEDKRQLGWNEITAALLVRIRSLLGRYAREVAALAAEEWWSLGLTGVEFKARMAAVLQSVLADVKSVAKEADSDLGLELEVEPLVADLNNELQAWCADYVERYGADIGLYGLAETGIGAQQAPEEVPHSQPSESTSASEDGASGQAARTKSTDRKRTEAERRALVLGTAGLPTGKPPAGTFASDPKIRKLVDEHPELLPHVSLVAHLEKARAEAEVAFRQRELTEQWGLWSGVHPWDDKPSLETTDCPWWVAGAEYVFRVVVDWRAHFPAAPERTEALLSEQVRLTANWVYWNRVFVHDGVHSKSPKPEDLLGNGNAERFSDFAYLFALQRFAEKDFAEWQEQARLLAGAVTDLEVGRATQSVSSPVAGASDPLAPAGEKARAAGADNKLSDEPEPASVANGGRTDGPTFVRESAKGAMATVSEIFEGISKSCLPDPIDPLLFELEAIRGRHVAAIRQAIPYYDIGCPSADSRRKIDHEIEAMAEAMLERILNECLGAVNNAGVYERTARTVQKPLRSFIVRTWHGFVGDADESEDLGFGDSLDCSLDKILETAVSQAWAQHEVFFQAQARNACRPQMALPEVESAQGIAAGSPGDSKAGEPSRDRTDAPSGASDLIRPRRTPDLDSSRERLALVGTLARELATIKPDLKRFCTADNLKQKHPQFILWEHIDKAELKELTDGAAFAPKAYAEHLTLRKFGLTSRETLKKDRRKLRKAEKAGRQ